MIKYGDLVQYIKENHVNWNTDLFDVLRGFFNQYSPPPQLPPFPDVQYVDVSHQPVQQELIFEHQEFHEPTDKHYTTQDLINLLEA